MDSQELKYQQLLSARHKYSKHTRAKAKKFKQLKEMEKENMAIKQQEQEIAEVEDELTELRREYEAVCRERGHAHKVAQLVQLQEKEVERFQDRMDQICVVRAKATANAETRKYIQSQFTAKKEKEDVLTRRRQLMNTDWNLANGKSFDKDISRELQELIQLEKQLEKKLNDRKISTMPNEASLERETKKVSWPEEPQSNWNFLADESSSLISRAMGSPVNSVPNVRSPTTESPTEKRSVDLDLFRSITDPDFPVQIAERVMERLKHLRLDNAIQSEPLQSRLYKDAAINTSYQPLETTDSNLGNSSTSSLGPEKTIASGDTSFRSLPGNLMDTTRLKRTVKVITDKLKQI